MKKPIPECQHENEYEFERGAHWISLVLTNGTNRIYLSKMDFDQLVKLVEKESE